MAPQRGPAEKPPIAHLAGLVLTRHRRNVCGSSSTRPKVPVGIGISDRVKGALLFAESRGWRRSHGNWRHSDCGPSSGSDDTGLRLSFLDGNGATKDKLKGHLNRALWTVTGFGHSQLSRDYRGLSYLPVQPPWWAMCWREECRQRSGPALWRGPRGRSGELPLRLRRSSRSEHRWRSPPPLVGVRWPPGLVSLLLLQSLQGRPGWKWSVRSRRQWSPQPARWQCRQSR